MAMACPQCNQIFEQQERICPTCSIQLLFYARMAPANGAVAAPEDMSGHWQHTAVGRILVGLLLAQGLALGLKQLLTAGFLASGDEASATVWSTLTGLALLHSLHLAGLLLGGALAGAGQSRGILYGCLAGLANGMIFLILQPQTNSLLPEGAHYAQPLLHGLFGALGGLIGRAIWRPTPRLTLPQAMNGGAPMPALIEMRWLHGPIAWGRVAAGATIMSCGVVWSNMIMSWMIDASHGTLNLTTHFQARLVSWEIAGLTMLIGACLAGATTWNGMKQGLCVGVGGAVLYLGYQFANPTKAQLESTIFAVTCMLGLGLAGGWFGAQLFPPLDPLKLNRRTVEY